MVQGGYTSKRDSYYLELDLDFVLVLVLGAGQCIVVVEVLGRDSSRIDDDPGGFVRY